MHKLAKCTQSRRAGSHTQGFSLAPEPASPTDGDIISKRKNARHGCQRGWMSETLDKHHPCSGLRALEQSRESSSPGHVAGRPAPRGSPAPQPRPPARLPTLRHVQLEVAGGELIQALLELGGARRFLRGLWSLMGETEQESPRVCVEGPWSLSRLLPGTFCALLPPPATSSLPGMLLCGGAPKAGSNLIGARGPLASAVGLMLQGNQVTASGPPPSFAALQPNPTEQTN